MNIWSILVDQVLLPVIGVVVAGILAWLTGVLAKKANYSLTTEQQATLHSALMTGLRAAIMKGLGGNDAVQAAITYALNQGAPDAIKKLGVTTDTLWDLGLSKLSVLQGESTAASATPTPST